MNIDEFENNFFYHLKGYSNEVFTDIDNYGKIIENIFYQDDLSYVKGFLDNFNSVVVESNSKFDYFEKILNHPLLKIVFDLFKDSNVIMRACDNENEKCLKWLRVMDINTCYQDKNGVTALMVACQHPKLFYMVKYFIGHDPDNIQLKDNNGENALFYAANNIDAFRALLNAGVDCSVKNKDNDTILTYCARNKIYEPIRSLGSINGLDLNSYNSDERTAVMYLVEDGRFDELKYLFNEDINFNFKNQKNESALSILVHKYYEHYQNLKPELIYRYFSIIKVLVDKNVNFNVIIDNEGNTPIMYFIMIEDWNTMAYLLLNSKNIDLSIQNINGESASSLCIKLEPNKTSEQSGINVNYLIDLFIHHPTFDSRYVDKYGNNLLMYCISMYYMDTALNLLKTYKFLAGHMNENEENALIIATKLGYRNILRPLLNSGNININLQDCDEKCALHYAVDLNDYYFADVLALYQADITLKDKEGISPFDIACNSQDEIMKNFLLHPIVPYEFNKLEKNKGKFTLFKKNIADDFRDIKVITRDKYKEKYGSLEGHLKRFSKYKPLNASEIVIQMQRKALKTYFVIYSYGVGNTKGSVLDHEKLFNIDLDHMYSYDFNMHAHEP